MEGSREIYTYAEISKYQSRWCLVKKRIQLWRTTNLYASVLLDLLSILPKDEAARLLLGAGGRRIDWFLESVVLDASRCFRTRRLVATQA